ncbi:hypothetical protein V5F49_03155 [Xanthobacter sp. V3C-3]|uniref:hypothetical protein n=1 Tax=Xanthobacter lutulentifluminis TaxID=3119935 RepID=UPI003728EDA7
MFAGAQRQRSGDLFFVFLVITFLAFAVRDGLTGVLRYGLGLAKLDVLWFIPDFMSFAVIGVFAYQQIFEKRNLIGILFIANFVVGLIIGTIFMDLEMLTFMSALKSLTPIFVGFAFYDRAATEFRWARIVIFLILMASIVGVILNPYIEYPWTGQTMTSFGVERAVGKLWWTGGEVRYGGFAGDSTMAAFTIFVLYVLLSFRLSLLRNLMLWPLVVWPIYVTTSKTALGTVAVYFIIYLACQIVRNRDQNLELLRLGARLSFLLILVPPILIIAFGGFDLSGVSPVLSSMSDRIDNTWRGPFVTIAEIFPTALITGCGVGCYAYPMTYTSLSDIYFALDNFYLTTYMMLGVPFLFFVVMQIYCIRYNMDRTKLALIILMNVYTVTVQCYGPSFATLMLGYVFSASFAAKWQHFARAMPTPPRHTVRSAAVESRHGMGLRPHMR